MSPIIVPICDQKEHLEERSVHFPTFTADGAKSDLKAPPRTNILCDAPGSTEISVGIVLFYTCIYRLARGS